MTRVAICCSVLLLLLAASVGATAVTNIELKKSDGFVTARIDIDGKMRFTHQTEEAKDGRPFRVIVDILSATHELGAKEFSVLPSCLISGIRTSQYAVNPEQVVRIVFDMKASPIYRVELDNNSVSVFFTDQTGKDFSPWSTAEFVKKTASKPAVSKQPAPTLPLIATTSKAAAKSAASQNKVIANDRLASLEGNSKPAAKTVVKPEISKASVKRAAVVKVPPKPELDNKQVGPKEQTVAKAKHTAQVKPNSTVANKKKAATKPALSKWSTGPQTQAIAKKQSSPKVPVPAVTKKTVAKPKSETKPSPKVAARSSVKIGTGPVQGPPPPPVVSPSAKTKIVGKDTKSKTTVAKAEPVAKKQTGTKAVAQKKTRQTVAKKVATTKTVLAKAKKVAKAPPKQKGKAIAKVSKPAAEEKGTSRFRRKPVVSKKIRGTLVAEFPKRLTIKYRGRSSHDPFETLINEARRFNEPLDKRIPNVEGLRLVGVIESDNAKNSALFEDKDGYGYILQSGDKVRKGYVLRVEDDRVYFQIFEYGWSRTMALKMDEY